MNDCILVSVMGSGMTRARYNDKARSKPMESKALIDPRDRVRRALEGLKGEILSDEQRTDRSKAWKQAIAGDKFIYNARHHHTRDD